MTFMDETKGFSWTTMTEWEERYTPTERARRLALYLAGHTDDKHNLEVG
jgi:hypothetical protein